MMLVMVNIDTPGTDRSTEPYKHAILLREGLTATKINTIFLIIKYDTRFEKMTENYSQHELPLCKYGKKIVVMISHWDQSKNPQSDFNKSIIQTISKNSKFTCARIYRNNWSCSIEIC
jgi:predicted GTPase